MISSLWYFLVIKYRSHMPVSVGRDEVRIRVVIYWRRMKRVVANERERERENIFNIAALPRFIIHMGFFFLKIGGGCEGQKRRGWQK
jgi:hypothetical protein